MIETNPHLPEIGRVHPRLIIVLLLELAWLTAGCSREQNAPATGTPSMPAASATRTDSLLPRIGGVTGYVGSDACQACHQKQYTTWHRSYHRTMTQLPTPEAVQANFNHVVLTNAGVRFILSRTNNAFWVHMESQVAGTLEHPVPQPDDVPLGLVTGSHHMQVFWVPNGMGNCQIGFPFTWLIPERRWVPRNSTFLRPPNVELRPETWNFVCARCHATATQPGLNRAALSWRTQVANLGIACEACHGPGERHAALERKLKAGPGNSAAHEPPGRATASAPRRSAMFAEPRRAGTAPPYPRLVVATGSAAEEGLREPRSSGRESALAASMAGESRLTPAPTNLWIVHPEKISPVRASQICGFCHAMKWWDDKEGWPERGFSFRPGDDLDATTPVMRPTQLEHQPWLKPALARNPDLFRDFFWSDGMIRVSGRDYNGLIESPCYRGGQFSCLSCHSLHGGDPEGQLARNRADNQACAQCHKKLAAEGELTAHTHHQFGSSGSLCYNCHMPHTTYGVLKAIRSHQVSSPKVADELATGRPNACNLCHLDKSLAWTGERLTHWYGQPAWGLPGNPPVTGASSPRPSPPRAAEERVPTGRTRGSIGSGADNTSGSNGELSSDEAAVADSVRLALSGDAGQRALIAWHFGWEPAWQASGRAWIPPALAQLLDDPYAAVRCVAERSLKQLAPGLVPVGYDYSVSPGLRPPVHEQVFERWRKEMVTTRDRSLPLPTRVRWDDPAATTSEFQRLTAQRDDRPVRLRE